jgi:hypothetical protein
MNPENFNPGVTLHYAVAWAQNFGAKTSTSINSIPEKMRTGRFERHTGAYNVHVSVKNECSDFAGFGDTGPPRSKMATLAPKNLE